MAVIENKYNANICFLFPPGALSLVYRSVPSNNSLFSLSRTRWELGLLPCTHPLDMICKSPPLRWVCPNSSFIGEHPLKIYCQEAALV